MSDDDMFSDGIDSFVTFKTAQVTMPDPAVLDAAHRYAAALHAQGELADKLHLESVRIAKFIGNDHAAGRVMLHQLEHEHGLACDELVEAEHELLVCSAMLVGYTRETAEKAV